MHINLFHDNFNMVCKLFDNPVVICDNDCVD